MASTQVKGKVCVVHSIHSNVHGRSRHHGCYTLCVQGSFKVGHPQTLQRRLFVQKLLPGHVEPAKAMACQAFWTKHRWSTYSLFIMFLGLACRCRDTLGPAAALPAKGDSFSKPTPFQPCEC